MRIETLGDELNRPECVIAHASGTFFCSDSTGNGGVAIIAPNGSVQRVLSNGPQLHPNGIALLADGSFLIAHLGTEYGGIYRLRLDGSVEPFLIEIGGDLLPPTNFVCLDHQERIWITVSTRLRPRDRAYRPDILDGFVILLDKSGARIVADGLGYTNECAIDERRGFFYINETFNRRVTRFRLNADGSLTDREIFVELGYGTYPDGLTLDDEGGLWMTSVVSNRLIYIDADGHAETIIENGDARLMANAESAFLAKALTVGDIADASRSGWHNLSSLAFCGFDLQDAVLGSLDGNTLLKIRMPVRGQKLPHWEYCLGLHSND